MEPVPVEELRKGLVSALGKSFEFIEGEAGRVDAKMGGWSAERFWFAKVRPKEPGEFAVSYSITFDFPKKTRETGLPPERATYTIPMKIGKRGAPRIVLPGSTFGGSTYPHANVGDAVLIPVHVGPFRRNHMFSSDKDDKYTQAFFSTVAERRHERYMECGSRGLPVRNDISRRLRLLACWGRSSVDRGRLNAHHEVTAYMEVDQPGEYNLAGRLLRPSRKAVEAGTPIRALPKDLYVTVVLEHTRYVERAGKFTTHSSGTVPGGTIHVRVGDRIVLGCGDYRTPVAEKHDTHRPSVVMALPFKDAHAYRPEPRED